MNKTEVKKKQMIAVCEMINLLNLWILHGIIGDRGVLYFAVAWLPLGLLSIVAADNVPDALSHMLRGRNTKGHSRSIGAIFQSVLIQQIIIGVIGSVLLLVFSQILAQKVFLFEHTTLAMRILAPTFFLRCILTVLLGRFQGEGSDSPTLMIGF
ncbi:MAG: hypothetical protein LBM69_02660, partial [Lachnospiraceae bacterium]|nr:hypothetical protein [Lachnospiraceae bacterium]